MANNASREEVRDSRSNARVRSFPLGRLLITPAVLDTVPSTKVVEYFRRHARGDFGDLCHEDFEANLDALATGARILSAYHHEDTKLYVITEADRSATTLLLADEY